MTPLQTRWRRIAQKGPTGAFEWGLVQLLRPLGWLYGTVQVLRQRLYEYRVLPIYYPQVPLISVGNLVVGGTGKTPVVLALVEACLNKGLSVAVVSRGYGGSNRLPVLNVSAENDDSGLANLCGDEPLLIARRYPKCKVFIARKRALGVQAAEQAGAQIILLDDGFQHLAVHRHINLLLQDQRTPYGNGFVLPAGLLRERKVARFRANHILLTRCEPLPEASSTIAASSFQLSQVAIDLDGQVIPLSSLSALRGGAFAGIADPEFFFNQLKASGLQLSWAMPFKDHDDFSPSAMKQLTQRVENEKVDYLITTEKDGVKIHHHTWPIPCYQVALVLKTVPDRFFDDLVTQALRLKDES